MDAPITSMKSKANSGLYNGCQPKTHTLRAPALGLLSSQTHESKAQHTGIHVSKLTSSERKGSLRRDRGTYQECDTKLRGSSRGFQNCVNELPRRLGTGYQGRLEYRWAADRNPTKRDTHKRQTRARANRDTPHETSTEPHGRDGRSQTHVARRRKHADEREAGGPRPS